MDIILIVIGLLFLGSLRPIRGPLDSKYLDRTTTSTINGLFILLVIFSHFMTYVNPTSLNRLSDIWMSSKGQLIVATFLFFSGFGIMTQLMKKGKDYINTFPVKRILFVWIKFIVAVGIFVLISLFVLHKNIAPMRIFWSFFGLMTVGNSGWYIFAVILMYIFTYVAFKIFGDDFVKALGFILLISIVYILIANHYGMHDYYYDTILCYWAGMTFALHRTKVETMVISSNARYGLSFVINALVFLASYYLCYRTNGGGLIHYISYEVAAIAFAFLFVLIAMKFSIKNSFLAYAGGNAMFSLYILQRIPMELFQKTTIVNKPVLYFIGVLISTFIIGWLFDQLIDKLLRRSLKK